MTDTSALEVRTSSDVPRSTESSVAVHTDTCAKVGKLTVQKSNGQTKAECVDSKADAQVMDDIEKCRLTTRTISS